VGHPSHLISYRNRCLRVPRLVQVRGTADICGVQQLKSDFLAARWIAFEAIYSTAPETGKYLDTLDYATYGVA